VTRGPYAVIRHPVHAAYVLIQCGYVLQAISVRNIAVLALATRCNAGRAICEERALADHSDYAATASASAAGHYRASGSGYLWPSRNRTLASRRLGGI
jgi:hypothetical protein